MSKWVTVAASICAAMGLVAAAAAAPPSGQGPYSVTNAPDTGCAGQTWATDNISRSYEVKKGPADSSGNKTYRLKRLSVGTFTTVAGQSPGGCAANTSPHGSTITAGVTGRLRGFLQGVVTGGTYNPNATCTGTCQTSSTAWVATFFGPSATFSCLADNAGPCTFEYHYTAPDSHLPYRHWVDQGTESTETWSGDIASS